MKLTGKGEVKSWENRVEEKFKKCYSTIKCVKKAKE